MKHIGVGTFKATPRMKELINTVLDSGRLSYGPFSLALEKRFAELHSSQYGILSNSGTSSLQVALQALKEEHAWGGDKVIVPATTFVATANIVAHCGMVPVFVDVDPVTYNMDPAKIEHLINRDVKCIIPVHLFGQPANMSAIKEVADKHGLKIIEDSCETMFVSHQNKPVGSWGDIACFSFYVAHILVAGVGGIGTTNNPAYAARMRSLVNHGMALDCLNPGDNFSPQPNVGRRFRFTSQGHSFRITELEAALALAQLDTYREQIMARQANARHLTARLQNINDHYKDVFQLPKTADGNGHAWMMYPIVLKEGDKEQCMAFLNERGIETRDMLPLLAQPVYKWLNPSDFPVSARIVEKGFYVGCHQDLTSDDIGYLADVLGLWVDPSFQGIYLGD